MSSKVSCEVFWILGKYITTISDIQSMLQEIRKVLGKKSPAELAAALRDL